MFTRRTCCSLFFMLFLVMLLGFSACGSTPRTQEGSGSVRGAPAWVNNPRSRYNENTYLAFVGRGDSREAADRSALRDLISYFGQGIRIDETTSTSFQHAISSGAAASYSEATAMQSTIVMTAGMESLVGAEIGDRWDNGRDFFAVAVMNKAQAATIYSDMVRANQTTINNLLNIPAADRFTLEAYARYQLAATIADVTETYENLLTLIGSPVPAGSRRGNEIKIEAQRIIEEIPIAISIDNDYQGRIQGAFTRALTALGFRTGESGSRYVLNIRVNSAPTDHNNSQFIFYRIDVDARLYDRNNVILPYNFHERDGHTSQREAESRTYNLAVRKIDAEYANLLRDYLSQPLPGR